jgi:alkylation response protein AidB-like acyl-CoA dehydrogenase
MAVLNEEQEMLRDMAREWTTNESPVAEFRKVRAGGSDEAFDRKAYATMAEMGWVGVVIPEDHGGSDFGWLSAGLVVEELGKTLTASPLVASTIAAAAILLGGSEEQQAKWLPGLASGEVIGTLAVDEGPRHDPAKIETTVSGGKLSGTKAFVHEAHGADLFVVAAKPTACTWWRRREGVTRRPASITDAAQPRRGNASTRRGGRPGWQAGTSPADDRRSTGRWS